MKNDCVRLEFPAAKLLRGHQISYVRYLGLVPMENALHLVNTTASYPADPDDFVSGTGDAGGLKEVSIFSAEVSRISILV